MSNWTTEVVRKAVMEGHEMVMRSNLRTKYGHLLNGTDVIYLNRHVYEHSACYKH